MSAVTTTAPGGEITRPRYVGDWELSGPWPGVPGVHPQAGVPYAGVHLILRLGTEPVGILEVDDTSPRAVALAAWEAYGDVVRERLREAGLPAPTQLGDRGLGLAPADVARLPWLVERAEVLASPPRMSVVMCTRGRPDRLDEALSGVTAVEYPDFEVILVDNAPTDSANEDVVRSRDWPVPVRYVVEERGGLSWARNAGFRASTGAIVCFLDDDELPDRHWLSEYARAFHRYPGAGLACGSIQPKRLDTTAEQAFERLGGHSKGRGLRTQLYDVTSHKRQHPLYPLPPFGAGGNMAFRRQVLETIGLFDVALGAGTPARGAEDTAAIAEAMLAGFALVWQPSAFVLHSHYPSFEGASQQLSGYWIGLTAFYTKMLVEDPRRLPRLVALFPRAVSDMVLPAMLPQAPGEGPPAGLPPDLGRAKVRGMLAGPRAYLRSRAAQRKVSGGAR